MPHDVEIVQPADSEQFWRCRACHATWLCDTRVGVEPCPQTALFQLATVEL